MSKAKGGRGFPFAVRLEGGLARVLGLGLGLLACTGLLAWQAGWLVGRSEELRRQGAEVERLRGLERSNRSLEQRLQALRQSWQAERGRLPSSEDYAGLVELLGVLAGRWGVAVGPLSPAVSQEGAFPRVSTPLELSGPFGRVLALMNALQTGERVIILKDVRFSLSDERRGEVRAEMVLEAYFGPGLD